jgi:hypothetical protein
MEVVRKLETPYVDGRGWVYDDPEGIWELDDPRWYPYGAHEYDRWLEEQP